MNAVDFGIAKVGPIFSEVNSEHRMDNHRKKTIKAAIVLMAQIITKREDGSKYPSVYDRLTVELNAMTSQSQRLDHIRKIAQR